MPLQAYAQKTGYFEQSPSPFYNYPLPSFNPSPAPVPVIQSTYDFNPIFNDDPKRGSTFNPFGQPTQLGPLNNAAVVPQSKPFLSNAPLLTKKDPDPYTEEITELRGPTATEETGMGDLLTWAIVLGGLATLYYYSKKKKKK